VSASVITAAPERADRPDPAAVSFAARLCDAAFVAGDLPLAQLLDWFYLVWTGRQQNASFRAGSHLPAQLHNDLRRLADRGGPAMRRAMARRALTDAAQAIGVLVEQHAAIDREFCRQLFVEPVSEVLQSAETAEPTDAGLLQYSAEELVSRANVGRHIPPNGRRWPLLVRATADVQARVAYLLDLARSSSPTDTVPAVTVDRLKGDLAPVAAAALLVDPDGDEEDEQSTASYLASVARASISRADLANAFRVSSLIENSGIAADASAGVLGPFHEVAERLGEFVARLPDDADHALDELHELVQIALANGDLLGAREALELMENEWVKLWGERKFENRVSRLAETSAGQPTSDRAKVQLFLDLAREQAGSGKLDRAEALLDEVEKALEQQVDPLPSDNPANDLANLPAPQPLGVADERSARILQSIDEAEATGDRDRLLVRLRQFGRAGPIDEVTDKAEAYLVKDPSLAVALLETALDSHDRQYQPKIGYLLAEALATCGDADEAARVRERTQPPPPPEELAQGNPLPGADGLHPWLPRIRATEGTSPEMAAAIGAADAGDADAARLFTIAFEAGSHLALAPAIGHLILQGHPLDALELYARQASSTYANSSIAWNLACAYAAAGMGDHALRTFRFFTRILRGQMRPEQREALEYFFVVNHETPPDLGPRPGERATASAGTRPVDEESEARRLYEAGRAQDAERRIRLLLRAAPRSPGAYLLLRMLREQRRLADARLVVREIELAGAATWRHHVELARHAIVERSLSLARDELAVAKRMGADDVWLRPLTGRLVAASPSPAPSPSMLRSSVGQPEFEVRARAGSLEPADWTSVVEAKLSAGEALQVLAAADKIAPDAPWAIGILVEAFRQYPELLIGNGSVAKCLRRITAESNDATAVDGLPQLLIETGHPKEAVTLLQLAAERAVPTRLPVIWHALAAALRAAGRLDEAADLEIRNLPPLPEDVAPGDVDPELVPTPILPRLVITKNTPEPVRKAQQLQEEEGTEAATDAWVAALRLGHALAFGPALGALVATGRPRQALDLYAKRARSFYVPATGAWNIGCAHAALGYFTQAARSFEYHARVTTRAYSGDQELVLERLFAAAGRPMPVPAELPSGHVAAPAGNGSAPRAGAPDRVSVAVAVFQAKKDEHSFTLASSALRAGMRGAAGAVVKAHLATVEVLYGQLASPGPVAAAELIRALIAADELKRGWNMALAWVRQQPSDTSVLAPAVYLACKLGQAAKLRGMLERMPRDFEVCLSLAKLARHDNDAKAQLRYANEALSYNPTCAEAMQLVKRGGATSHRGITQLVNANLIKRLQSWADDPAAVVAELAGEHQPMLASLREHTLRKLRLLVDLQLEDFDEARPHVARALEAVENEDWVLATSSISAALEIQPRHLGLSVGLSVCLHQLGRPEEAWAAAESISYARQGTETEVRLAFAAEDFSTAAELLAAADDQLPLAFELSLARAGLHEFFLADSMGAAGILLRAALRRLPGVPYSCAALAATLADRAGALGIRDSALSVLFAPKLTAAAAVAWAIGSDCMEELGHKTGPTLRREHLRMLVDHYGTGHRERLRRFLQQRPGRVFLEALAELEEQDGHVRAAFEARFTMLAEGHDNRLAILTDLIRFCDRTGYTDGYERALRYKKDDLGLEPTAEENERLAGQVDADRFRRDSELERLRAVLYELEHRDLRAGVKALWDPINVLLERLRSLAEGTGDAIAIEQLPSRWNAIKQGLQRLESAPGDLAAQQELAGLFAAGRGLAEGIGSSDVAGAVELAYRCLYQCWEELAVARRPIAAIPVSVTVMNSTRVPRGPAEVVFQLTAERTLGRLQLRAAGQVVQISGIEAGKRQEAALIINTDDQEIEVELASPEARDGAPVIVPVTIRPPTKEEWPVKGGFTPNTPATGKRFAGRVFEQGMLKFHYWSARDAGVPVRFLEGPREIGKTSLAKSLLPLEGPPEEWKIPFVIPAYIDGQAAPAQLSDLLDHIAAELANRLRELPANGLATEAFPAVPTRISDATAFRQWCDQLRAALPERMGLLVIIDEFQELLTSLIKNQALREVVNSLRSLSQNGTIALMLCGSCSLRTVDARLYGTPLAGEIREEPIGFLSEADTHEMFSRGFDGTVVIMRQALDAVWRLTGGHANHISLIGDVTATGLYGDRRRVVTRELVEEVARKVARSDSELTIKGILRPEEIEAEIDLMLELAERTQEPAEQIDEGALRRSLTSRERELLDRYIRIGLLRKEAGALRFTNELMWMWMQDYAKGANRRHIRMAERRPEETALRDAGYEIITRLSLGPMQTCLARRGEQRVIARRLIVAEEGGPSVTRDLLDEVLSSLNYSGPELEGVPQYLGPIGDWTLFAWVPGPSMRELLEQHRGEPVTPAEVVRWIVSACEVLTRVEESCNLTHGNLKPSSIIIGETGVTVIDWGYGAQQGRAAPLKADAPGYMSPQYLRRIIDDSGGATPADDVFALGVMLYQFLHPEGALPYGGQLADLDLSQEPPRVSPVVGPDSVLECVTKAIALLAEERHATPRAFAAALRAKVPGDWLRDDANPVEPHDLTTRGSPGQNIYIERVDKMGASMTTDGGIHVEGSVTNSVVGHKNRLRDSLNRVESADMNDDLKALLARLADSVGDLSGQLPAGEADGLARDFESFANEASSQAPRPGTIQRIGNDLVAIATTTGKIGEPVIKLIGEIMKFFH
jgi:tetratricopeptide (TPR) repeat protein